MHQCDMHGPGRIAPPSLGDRIKMNGAYRHPALPAPLDARGMVCIADRSRTYYTRPPCPSFKRAFSAPVSQVAFGNWKTALRRRREPADSFYFTISRSSSSLASRLRAQSTQHAARFLTRVTRFGLRVSPTFLLLSVLCAPLFVRRSSQCDSFSRGAGALHAKDHERPLGDLAFPWRAR